MAIVTSIFMLVMVVMMGVSYYQMQQVSPLQSEVMQTLKELNEANGENEALQQQVRQLDLLSRKAYFVKEGQLKVGLFILLAMAGVLVVSLNLYYRGTKTLPDKELDPVDEWMNKSRSRKYITWASAGAAAVVLDEYRAGKIGRLFHVPWTCSEAFVQSVHMLFFMLCRSTTYSIIIQINRNERVRE